MKWRNIKLYSPESKLQKYLSCKRQKHQLLHSEYSGRVLICADPSVLFCILSVLHLDATCQWSLAARKPPSSKSQQPSEETKCFSPSCVITDLLSLECLHMYSSASERRSETFQHIFTAITVSFSKSVTKYEIIFWIISHVLFSRSTENYSGCFR